MTIDWTTLNAYVDGELDPAAAASVAAAVAESPDLAARIASLSHLKAGIVAQHGRAATPRRLNFRPAAIAAALALVIAAGALGTWQSWRNADPAWVSAGIAAQEAWLDEVAAASRQLAANPSGMTHAVLPGTGRGAPDLTDAHLGLVYADTGSDSRFFGYEGVHGCHVGLWTGPDDRAETNAIGDRPILLQRNAIHAYTWRSGGELHMLMARGMPDARLGRLADLVATILERRHQLDDSLRLALQATASMAPPCA